MTVTLRLRLVGAQQAWGTRSRFDYRDTELAPTKSGVVGLMAAALGRSREADVTDLAALAMGVRADRPGVVMSDYQTALDVVMSDGKPGGTVLSRRAYLADAAFLVGLEGADTGLLTDLEKALRDPYWPLALGRRSFPPSLPLLFEPGSGVDNLVEAPLMQALSSCPPIVENVDKTRSVRYYIEDPAGEQLWLDQPIDNFIKRSFAARGVRVFEADWGPHVPQ